MAEPATWPMAAAQPEHIKASPRIATGATRRERERLDMERSSSPGSFPPGP